MWHKDDLVQKFLPCLYTLDTLLDLLENKLMVQCKAVVSPLLTHCQPQRMGHGQHFNLKWIWMDWRYCSLPLSHLNFEFNNEILHKNSLFFPAWAPEATLWDPETWRQQPRGSYAGSAAAQKLAVLQRPDGPWGLPEEMDHRVSRGSPHHDQAKCKTLRTFLSHFVSILLYFICPK